ncbi:MAG TPA: tRNA pseudouridine(55) synthase TruB [Actinomycetota bacterium]|nr:tRNA pseudouridine(55) synthase TruB [Actinomycetota bacterium]
MTRSPGESVDGVLVIDKPAGITSHDVVDRVRRVLKTRKVGHAGTLDPGATGVLVIGVGCATRFLDYSQAVPKSYRATAVWGSSTTTQDSSGEVVASSSDRPSEDEVRATCKRFTGAIEQVPPMVSAVKIGGERLYAKARRGETVERPARPVVIHELELLEHEGDGSTSELDVTCSAGTYIRTLIHDMGAALGCGGHMGSLRRMAAGGFSLDQAVDLDDVGAGSLHPLESIVRALDHLDVDADAATLVMNGRPLNLEQAGEGPVAVRHDGRLLAVYRSDGSRLVPERVVSH